MSWVTLFLLCFILFVGLSVVFNLLIPMKVALVAIREDATTIKLELWSEVKNIKKELEDIKEELDRHSNSPDIVKELPSRLSNLESAIYSLDRF